jgi:hypothetical protein
MANAVRVPHIKPIDLSGVSRSLDNIFSGGQRATNELTQIGKNVARAGAAIYSGGMSEAALAVTGISDEGKQIRNKIGQELTNLNPANQLAKTADAANKVIAGENARAEADMSKKQSERAKFAQLRSRQRSLIGGSQGRQSTILTSYLGQSGASSNAGKTLLGM